MGRAGNPRSRGRLEIYAEIVRRGVEEPGAWRVCRWRSGTLATLETRTNPFHVAARGAGRLGRIKHGKAGALVDPLRPRHIREWLGHEQLAGRAVERVRKAILVEVYKHAPHASADDQVGENHLGIRVVVPAVVRRELICPDERAVARPAREDAVRPLILAGALLRVVWARIAGAEVDEIELRVVRNPTPYRRAATPPRVALP